MWKLAQWKLTFFAFFNEGNGVDVILRNLNKVIEPCFFLTISDTYCSEGEYFLLYIIFCGQLTKLSSSQNLKKNKEGHTEKQDMNKSTSCVEINGLLPVALTGNKEAVLGVQNHTTFYDTLHEWFTAHNVSL